MPDSAQCEPDAALGNGGLGRLAACFMESMATLAIPAIGYGIRYDYGLFRQIISDGWQQEYPDDWLCFGNPWEFQRPEVVYHVAFRRRRRACRRPRPRPRAPGIRPRRSQAVAYDTPIVGWRGQHVNALRLWSARAPDPLKLDVFNTRRLCRRLRRAGARRGDLQVPLSERRERRRAANCACGRNISSSRPRCRIWSSAISAPTAQLRSLPQKAAVQLNDTHPSLAVAELMRILVDLHNFRWDEAWKITVATLVLHQPHAAAGSAGDLAGRAVRAAAAAPPARSSTASTSQHLALAERALPGDVDFRASVSLIDEKRGRRVRMGQLAFVGSHRINGVSAMHSDLMKETVFHDLNHLYPGRITNKTNGITFRRWLMLANPKLTALLREACGDGRAGRSLAARAARGARRRQRVPAAVPRGQARTTRCALARLIGERLGIKVDPSALFDVQIKRIHEYKRQLLNILETVALYQAIKRRSAAATGCRG